MLGDWWLFAAHVREDLLTFLTVFETMDYLVYLGKVGLLSRILLCFVDHFFRLHLRPSIKGRGLAVLVGPVHIPLHSKGYKQRPVHIVKRDHTWVALRVSFTH